MRVPLFVFFAVFSLFGTMLFALPTTDVQAGIIPCGLTNDDLDQAGDQTVKCTLCHIVVGVNSIIILTRNLMSVFAVVVVVAMSIVYITSGGDTGRMEFAKKGITAALIGFAIVLLAWLAVNFVLTLPIFNNNGLIKADWQKFTCDTESLAKPK
ncbi:MAG: hypothetical protein ACEQSB_05275 [Undibacterium sp.]